MQVNNLKIKLNFTKPEAKTQFISSDFWQEIALPAVVVEGEQIHLQ